MPLKFFDATRLEVGYLDTCNRQHTYQTHYVFPKVFSNTLPRSSDDDHTCHPSIPSHASPNPLPLYLQPPPERQHHSR